jgi:hypothetical protein
MIKSVSIALMMIVGVSTVRAEPLPTTMQELKACMRRVSDHMDKITTPEMKEDAKKAGYTWERYREMVISDVVIRNVLGGDCCDL